MDLDYINDVEENLYPSDNNYESKRNEEHRPILSAYEEEIKEIYELAKMVHEIDPNRDISDLIKEFIFETKQRYGIPTDDDTFEIDSGLKR